jgi:hypothetical protein
MTAYIKQDDFLGSGREVPGGAGRADRQDLGERVRAEEGLKALILF